MQSTIAHDLEAKTRTKDVILEENVNFDTLLLPSHILKGLTNCGFWKPSPIQFKAIPLGRCGFDLIVKSKSGTGKTLVFSIIALETVNVNKTHVQVLILVPTREIAVQIQEVLKEVSHFLEGLIVESFIGGLPLEDDIKKAKQCHIAVGAPGRVKHLINVGALSTELIRLFVLDEADKLMETSFQGDINEIFNTLPQRKQLIASSATYPQELDTFLTNYMLSPTHVTSENETPILLGLKQFVTIIKTSNPTVVQLMKSKNESLLEIFSKIAFTQCLVFSNYQTRAESISNFLNQKGWNSSFISAAQSQPKRLEAVNNLKEFKSRILLSTDLTSRGIDAPNVDLVINYDIPQDAVTYLHRMGRAGRYGSSGICINLAMDGGELKQLQTILGTIGATNLAISVLPTLNENSCDLWQIDPSTLQQISGSVPSQTSSKFSEEIKKEVMTLKQVKQANNHQDKKKRPKRISGKSVKVEQITVNSGVENILKNKEKEMQDICEKYSDGDTEDLFSSLASGTTSTTKVESDEDNKKRKTDSILAVLAGDINLNNDGESIKRKRISLNEFSNGLHKEHPVKDNKHIVFHKNKALLSITKLLCDPASIPNSDVIESIDKYLIILKKEETGEPHYSSVEEILSFGNDCLQEMPKISEEVFQADTNAVLEEIFKIGYEFAIEKESKSWLHCFPHEEIQRFQEICKEEIAISSESEEMGEDEADYEMEEYAEEENEMMGAESDQNQDIALQWVPVVHNEASSDLQSEHLAKCYEDCSNVLWQSGLTFETVEEFDDWYYQWQEQLQSVRSYVQQNIYVEEMNKYQQSRFSHK